MAAITVLALAATGAQAAKFKVLHSFCESHHRVCGDGSNPQGPLVADAVGNFFGTTATGGFGLGTVFELARKPNGNYNFKTLYRFCSQATCGGNPSGALVIDAQGNLYGTATDLVFELSPGGKRGLWTEKVLYRFCSQQNCTDGENAVGGLTYAGASSGVPYDGVSPLHGATGGGGANGAGVAFRLTNDSGSWTEAVLYDFCSTGGDKCLDGSQPDAGLTIDADGNLYGTARIGGGGDVKKGGAGTGVVFELSQTGESWTQSVLYHFCSQPQCADGAFPNGELTFDSAGALIGTTRLGGRICKYSKTYGCGTVFRLSNNGSGWAEEVLYTFCQLRDCRDGWIPLGALLLTDGNIRGVTQYGGGNDIDQFGFGGGTAYVLSGSQLQTLHHFCSATVCSDGAYPEAGVTESADGDFLGTSFSGGAFSSGTIYRLKN